LKAVNPSSRNLEGHEQSKPNTKFVGEIDSTRIDHRSYRIRASILDLA
jgi:hypothetical protein